MNRYIEKLKSYKDEGLLNNEGSMWKSIEDMDAMLNFYQEAHPEEYHNMVKNLHEKIKGEHFDKDYAEYEVSKMHHTDTERKEVRGEIVSLLAATEVYNKYRNLLPNKTTIADLYVALNYPYHRYINLFEQWFGDNALEKIIEASITSWFKDEDIPNGGKIWKHFKEY